jgi:phenylalanyl-tRNA synthetase beta chain
MMCSAKELNLAEDAEGLLILPAEAKIGTPIGELFPATPSSISKSLRTERIC